ncbi:MAG: hypothetical protein ACJ8C3_20205 [Microvirga sp.]
MTAALDQDWSQWTTDDWLSYERAVEVVGNWRSCHGYPLNTFQVNLRQSARRIDQGALVAQRTKRLVSIALKLQRFPKMKLTQMQDIGAAALWYPPPPMLTAFLITIKK